MWWVAVEGKGGGCCVDNAPTAFFHHVSVFQPRYTMVGVIYWRCVIMVNMVHRVLRLEKVTSVTSSTTCLYDANSMSSFHSFTVVYCKHEINPFFYCTQIEGLQPVVQQSTVCPSS